MKKGGIPSGCIYGMAGKAPASVSHTIGLAGHDSGLLGGAVVGSTIPGATDIVTYLANVMDLQSP